MGMGSLPYGKSLIPRPLALAAGLIIVLAAAVAGWLAAGQLANRAPVTAPTAPAVNVTSGAASLQLRAGWQLDKRVPHVPGLEGAETRALAPADGGRGRMVVTMLQDAPTGAIPQ